MIDIIPAAEDIIEFDHNSLCIYFPLPFRILFLFILGVWLWGANIHYLSLCRIDVGPMIRYTRHSPPGPPLYRDVYEVAGVLSMVWFVGLLYFWKVTGGTWAEVERWEVIPFICALICLGLMLSPMNLWHKKGRWRFLRMLRRISIGGLDSELRFADTLLADAFTSYAKVLGDTWILLCMSLINKTSSATSMPDRLCGGKYAIPFVMAVPYLIRLRQCLTEYVKARGKVGKKEANAHLWNAAKYSSAFPVIWMSALMRDWDWDKSHVFSRHAIETLWILFVFFNSLFSFYWDVTFDWDLSLFTENRTNLEYPYGLRQTRTFSSPEFYYSVIALDFLMRCTWSFKLSPHLGYLNDLEGGIFLLELLEVLRRWMWVFLRIEKEWCSRTMGLGGIDVDGLLLGKIDED